MAHLRTLGPEAPASRGGLRRKRVEGGVHFKFATSTPSPHLEPWKTYSSGNGFSTPSGSATSNELSSTETPW